MLKIRTAKNRGHVDHGWLDSFHSFSFASYFDPEHMHFGNLRVINENTVLGGEGFDTHSHRDMEIVSYVLDGALAHADSLGNGRAEGVRSGIVRPGDVQRISAGTGVQHSEFNQSKDVPVHFLQIWIVPDQLGIEPSYEQIHVGDERKRGQLALVAAPEPTEGAVLLHADARIHSGLFDGQERQEIRLSLDRLTYVHLARGSLQANGWRLDAGDALLMRLEESLVLEHGDHGEVLVIDLAD